MSAGFSLDPQKMEPPQLTEREIAVRDLFVDEYQKDNDPYRACIRMGFLAAFAPDQAKLFMNDGYVLRKLAYLQQQSVAPNDQDKAEMLANLRWLCFNGSAASRAQATKQYMEAQGYIKKNEDGAEAHAAALVDALREFSQNQPT
jgi:hypothetical protein